MKPKPFASLNHFTVPVATADSFRPRGKHPRLYCARCATMERANSVGSREGPRNEISRGREGPAAGTLPEANPAPGSDAVQHRPTRPPGQSDSGFPYAP